MYRIIADDGTPLLPGDAVLYEYSRNDVETLHGTLDVCIFTFGNAFIIASSSSI
jgi:hypothetical protein